MRFIGVDLAWGARQRTGLAVAVDGHVVDSTSVVDDDEICAWLEPHLRGPALVAVDAPLIVRNAAGTSRPCDRTITSVFGSSHAGAHSANLGIAAFAAGIRAERLALRLDLGTDPTLPRGQPVRRMIEVYPHPAMVSLFGLRYTLKYKAKRGRDLRSRSEAFADLVRHLTTLDSGEPRAVRLRLWGRRPPSISARSRCEAQGGPDPSIPSGRHNGRGDPGATWVGQVPRSAPEHLTGLGLILMLGLSEDDPGVATRPLGLVGEQLTSRHPGIPVRRPGP